MKVLFTFFQLAVIAGGLAVSAVPAFSQGVIYGTLGAGGSFDTNNSIQLSSGFLNGYADRFTSPVTADVGSILLAVQGIAGSDITLTIRSNLSVGPGEIVGSFNPTAISTNLGIVIFTPAASFQLDAGAAYWLTAICSSGQVNWFSNDQNLQSVEATHIGSSWQVNQIGGPSPAFEIDAVPEPRSVALGATGLLLGLAWRWRWARLKTAPAIIGVGMGCLIFLVCNLLCGCSRSGSRAAEMLGGPLPASATDIHVGHQELIRRNDGAKIMTDDFLSMAISREDFTSLAGRLELRHDPHAFDQGSWLLKTPGQEVATETSPVWVWKGETKQTAVWWMVTNTNDDDTLINFQSLLPQSETAALTHLTNTGARYENGHLYFRRQIRMWASKPRND